MRGGGRKKQMGKKNIDEEEVKENKSFEDCLWCLAAKVGESRAEALKGQCPVEHRGEFSQLKWPNWTTSGDLG